MNNNTFISDHVSNSDGTTPDMATTNNYTTTDDIVDNNNINNVADDVVVYLKSDAVIDVNDNTNNIGTIHSDHSGKKSNHITNKNDAYVAVFGNNNVAAVAVDLNSNNDDYVSNCGPINVDVTGTNGEYNDNDAASDYNGNGINDGSVNTNNFVMNDKNDYDNVSTHNTGNNPSRGFFKFNQCTRTSLI